MYSKQIGAEATHLFACSGSPLSKLRSDYAFFSRLELLPRVQQLFFFSILFSHHNSHIKLSDAEESYRQRSVSIEIRRSFYRTEFLPGHRACRD